MILIFNMTSGHGAGVASPRSMRVDRLFFFLPFFFLWFSYRFSLFFSLCLSSYFILYCTFISYFRFILACLLRQAGLLKKDKVKDDFRTRFFRGFFYGIEGFWCPPSMCFRTNTTSIQVYGTGTYKEININIIHE